MKRKTDLYWPFFGILFSVPFYFGLFKIPSISLEVISILFGGLLALLLILPTIENFRQIKKLKNSGHIEDLVYYIRLPLTLSILFIVVEFFSDSIVYSIGSSLLLNYLQSFYFGLWGVFFLALFRLITIIPHLLYNRD